MNCMQESFVFTNTISLRSYFHWWQFKPHKIFIPPRTQSIPTCFGYCL